jgi:hypothetical protein
VRSLDGCELPLPTWERFAGEDPLGARAYEQMMIGVATRKYERSLEPIGAKDARHEQERGESPFRRGDVGASREATHSAAG